MKSNKLIGNKGTINNQCHLFDTQLYLVDEKEDVSATSIIV